MVPKHLQRRYIAYYRVSTDRQGRSGLGLEAQEAAVEGFLKRTGGTLLKAFTEIQSGKDDDREQLHAALRLCHLSHSTLLIAKLDRLSRNAAFLLQLQQSGVRFVAADMPEANETIVGFLAVMAQAERQAISDRTKAALAAAKARGVVLGNPKLKPGTRGTAAHANAQHVANADARAGKLAEIIRQARESGCESLREIAGYLNEMGVTTARGSVWTATAVSRVLDRIDRAA